MPNQQCQSTEGTFETERTVANKVQVTINKLTINSIHGDHCPTLNFINCPSVANFGQWFTEIKYT